MRTDQLLASFERTVWAMRFRCMNCHTEGTPQNDKNRKEYGDRVAWVKKAGPAATMEYLISSKLIDAADPEKSLLLQKPLGKVKHEGGIKFVVGDQGYKAFREWIDDVAAIRAGKYKTAADLPRPLINMLAFGTEAWLKLSDTPADWGDKLLQVTTYAWDSTGNKGRRIRLLQPIGRSGARAAALPTHAHTICRAGSDRAKAFGATRSACGEVSAQVYLDKDDLTREGLDSHPRRVRLRRPGRDSRAVERGVWADDRCGCRKVKK